MSCHFRKSFHTASSIAGSILRFFPRFSAGAFSMVTCSTSNRRGSQLSQHRMPGRGWNSVVSGYISRTVMNVVSHHSCGYPLELLHLSLLPKNLSQTIRRHSLVHANKVRYSASCELKSFLVAFLRFFFSAFGSPSSSSVLSCAILTPPSSTS